MAPPAATTAGRALGGRAGVPSGRVPRRVSGPVRGRTAAPPRHADDPLAVRALRRGRTLADSRLLDRLVAGRLWIPLVGLALMGIVAMQVSMLKMNAGISRAVESASTLERQNAVFRADVSRLEAGSRVDEVAHQLGMVVPADGNTRYALAGGTDKIADALKRMTAPSADALARAKGQVPVGTATTAATPTATATAPPAAQAVAQQTPPATQAQAPAQQPVQTQQQQPQQAVQQATAPASTPTAAPQQAAQSPPAATTAGAVAAPTGTQG